MSGSRARISPWANKTIAPMQAAGALIPFAISAQGPVGLPKEHGTAFFITNDGIFLTAAHVIEDYPNEDPPLAVSIFSARGLATMPVRFITKHPTADVALGVAEIDESHGTRPVAMTLSTRRLCPGDHVAVLGYAQTETTYREDHSGRILTGMKFLPDYYEGEILEHHSDGVGLARNGPAYSTDIVPPSATLKDLGGASGGPLDRYPNAISLANE